MAQKQKKRKAKRGVLRTVLFYVLFPLVVWFVAFLLWFYWHDLTRLFGHSEPSPKMPVQGERRTDKGEHSNAASTNQPKEKLFDEDRKKLDEILKRRP
jgi:hypothetical protein